MFEEEEYDSLLWQILVLSKETFRRHFRSKMDYSRQTPPRRAFPTMRLARLIRHFAEADY